MARGFALTAALQLQAPRNLNAVVGAIQGRLNSINTNISVRINAAASRNVTTLNRNIQALNQTLTQLSVNSVTAANNVNFLAAALRANGVNLNALGASANNASNNMNNAGRAARSAASSVEDFASAGANAIKRYASFATATTAVYSLIGAMKTGINEAISFQSEIVKIAQVTGTSIEDLSGLQKEVTRLSTSLGVSSAKLINVSQILAQAGLTSREVKIGLEALAKTELAATFTDVEKTVEGAIASMKQFDIGIGDLEKTLGSFNSVAGAFAVESDDIVTAVRRSGASFAAAGGNINQFIALFTSVRQTTRESAESIATGFRTIFTRFQRPKTVEFLREMGIELTDLEGKFVGPYEAIRRLSTGLATLDTRDLKFAKVIEELGGFRQVSKVIPLIQQFAVAEKALGVAIKGETSLTKDAEVAQQSFLVQLTKVREEFFALFRTIGDDSSVQAFGKLMLEMARNAIKLAEALTPLVPLITTIGTIKLGGALLSVGRGVTRRHEGGQISRFARGGLVPGQGNRDTVPSLLQPGEFVLTKKAVQGIGAEKLANANRYASGGRIGVVSLNKTANPSPITVTGSDVYRNAQGQKIKGALPAGLKSFSKTYDVSNSALFDTQEEVSKMLSQVGIDSILKQGIASMSQGIASKIGASPIDVGSVKRIPNYSSIIGGLFEGALAGIGQPYDSHAGYEQAPFDFPGGLNAGGLGAIPTDAKKTFSKDTNKSLRGKISKLAREQYAQEIELAVAKTMVNKPGVKTSDLAGFFRAFESGKASPKDFGLTQGAAKAALVSAKRDFEGRRTGAGTFFVKKANGGIGSDTDTVPALLTPGEFVINKKSAQRIGYGNLNSMNRVHKFARGGTVGGSKPLVGGAAGLALLAPSLFSSFDSLSDGAKESADALGRLTQQGASLVAVLAFTGRKLGDFSGAQAVFRNAGRQGSVRGAAGAIFNRRAFGRLAPSVLQGGAIAAGAGTFIAGDSLGRSGQKRLEKGDIGGFNDFSKGAGLSGSATGIGAGLAVGSLAGPYGAAAGALIGGLIGYAAGIKEADEKAASLLSQSRLEKTLEQFDNLDSQSKLGVITKERANEIKFGEIISKKKLADARGLTVNQEDPFTFEKSFGKAITSDEVSNGAARAFLNFGRKINEQIFNASDSVGDVLGTQTSINRRKFRSDRADDKSVISESNKLIADNKGAIIDEINRLLKTSKNFEDFQTKKNESGFTGQDLADILGPEGGATVENLRKINEDKQIAYQKELKAIQAMVKAAEHLNAFTDATNASVAAFSQGINKLEQAFALFDGNGVIGNVKTQIVESIDTAINSQSSNGKIAQRDELRNSLLANFNNGSAGVDRANSIADTALAKAVLPQILEELRAVGGTNPFNKDAFNEKLDKFRITNPNSVKFLGLGFDEAFDDTNDQAKTLKPGERDSIILKRLQDFADIAKKSIDEEAKFAAKLDEIHTRRLAIESKLTDITLKQTDLRQQLRQSQRDFGGSSFLTPAALTADAEQFSALRFKQLAPGGGNFNLDTAGQRVTEFRSRAKNALERGDVESYRTLTTAANDLSKALEFAASDTSVLIAKQNELVKAQEERATRKDFVKDFAFAGNEGRQSIIQDVQNAFAVANNSLITGTSEQESGALRILDKFKDLGVFGNGKTGQDIIDERIKGVANNIGLATGLNPQDAAKIAKELIQPTSKEDKLQKAIEVEFGKLIDINTQLKNIQSDNLDALRENVVAIVNLTKTLNDNNGFAPAEAKARGGKIGYYANGGMFKPRGTDTVPAMLTPGEFVVTRKAAKAIGYGNLNKMNTMYAAGGGGANLGALYSQFDAVKRNIAGTKDVQQRLALTKEAIAIQRQISQARIARGRANGVTEGEFNSRLDVIRQRNPGLVDRLNFNAKTATSAERKKTLDLLYRNENNAVIKKRTTEIQQEVRDKLNKGVNPFSNPVDQQMKRVQNAVDGINERAGITPAKTYNSPFSSLIPSQSAPNRPELSSMVSDRPMTGDQMRGREEDRRRQLELDLKGYEEAAQKQFEASLKSLDAARLNIEAANKNESIPHKIDVEMKPIDFNVTGLSKELYAALGPLVKKLAAAEATKAVLEFAKNNLAIDVPRL